MTIYSANVNGVSRIFILVMFLLLFEMHNYLISLELVLVRKLSGAPNSAKFRGGCRGPSKIRQRGGFNNFLLFMR